jgi:RNA polymerase sigma-70 factor (ECF subfamily)
VRRKAECPSSTPGREAPKVNLVNIQEFFLKDSTHYELNYSARRVGRGGGSMVPDEVLVKECLKGDREAFAVLVERYQGKIYNLAYRLLGNADDASDLTQEAFCRAYAKLSEFRGEAAFGTWLYRIANNLCLDELRRRQRRAVVSLSDEENRRYLQNVPGENPGAAELCAHRAVLARLHEVIATLPPDQRTVLVLRDIQGLSYEEIAQVMGCSLGTVKSRLNRARRALRDKLSAERELFYSDGVYSG